MCDTLCQLQSSGALFAKNSDRPPSEPQAVVAMGERRGNAPVSTQYLTIDGADAFAGIISQPTWLWGAEHGVNRHGVAIGNEKVWTTSTPSSEPTGLIGMDLVRLGLERGRTATQAVDIMTSLLEEHGQAGIADQIADEAYFSSFLVMDATSGWIVETSGSTWVAQPIERAASISNRISLGTQWTLASPDVPMGFDADSLRDGAVPTEIADGRLAATRRALTAEVPLTPTRAMAALRDHGNGPWGGPQGTLRRVDQPPRDLGEDFSGMTVCMHIEGYMATTASMVVAVGADGPIRVWAAPGSPCVAPYVPAVIIEDTPIVPTLLGDLQVWQSFAVLRDQIMSNPRRLDEVRAVMAPVEDELMERAASLGGDGEAWSMLHHRAHELVVAGLRVLGC